MPAPKGHKAYPGSETGGRPTIYTKEKIEEYADELEIWIKDINNYWLKDFCLERGISGTYLAIWAKKNEKFNRIFKVAYEYQESKIFKGAMKGTYNHTMSKMALTNFHQWAEKTETKISGDSENPLSFLLNVADGKSKDLVNDE